MARSYCTTSDVRKYLPNNVKVEGDVTNVNVFAPTPTDVVLVDIDFFIQQACADIDSSLATIVDIPLKKINVGGDIMYPYPINRIASLLAADLIYRIRLKGSDRQNSETLKDEIEWAHQTLSDIQNGQIRLLGQEDSISDRFVRQSVRNIVKNPVSGGKSEKH